MGIATLSSAEISATCSHTPSPTGIPSRSLLSFSLKLRSPGTRISSTAGRPARVLYLSDVEIDHLPEHLRIPKSGRIDGDEQIPLVVMALMHRLAERLADLGPEQRPRQKTDQQAKTVPFVPPKGATAPAAAVLASVVGSPSGPTATPSGIGSPVTLAFRIIP